MTYYSKSIIRSKFEELKNMEENMVKDVRNLFRLKKEINHTTFKDKRNFFRLKKENTVIKDRILRDIRNPFCG